MLLGRFRFKEIIFRGSYFVNVYLVVYLNVVRLCLGSLMEVELICISFFGVI